MHADLLLWRPVLGMCHLEGSACPPSPGRTHVRTSSRAPAVGFRGTGWSGAAPGWGFLTEERDPQGAKHLAPLAWRGPVSKNKTNNIPPAAGTARPSGLCAPEPSSSRSVCRPYARFSLSLVRVLACVVSSAWDPLFSSGSNENPCSLRGLVSKSSVQV